MLDCSIIYIYILLTLVSILILSFNMIILWDHRRICRPSLTETSLCGAYLYMNSDLCTIRLAPHLRNVTTKSLGECLNNTRDSAARWPAGVNCTQTHTVYVGRPSSLNTHGRANIIWHHCDCRFSHPWSIAVTCVRWANGYHKLR